jgi:hypothetical protein
MRRAEDSQGPEIIDVTTKLNQLCTHLNNMERELVRLHQEV